MEETTDPVLEALRRSARVQDSELDTAELRAAFAAMAPPTPRPGAARMALVAASAAVIAGFGWQAFASSADHIGAATGDAPRVELAATNFDAAAADFPLPKGQTYTALRNKVLTQSKDESFTVGTGRMPTNTPASMSALVAKYSGCKWWQLESDGTFSELSPQQQREVQVHTKRALKEVLRVDAALKDRAIPLTDYWDALCKDVQ